MEKKEETKKAAGRPAGFSPVKKPEVKIEVQGEYIVLHIPKKDLSRKLLQEFL